MVSVLILTKNEEQDLPGCLESVAWCDDIHVYDSFSTDATIDIAQKASATITQRHFDNWAAHQNWGLANIPFKYKWVFYLDADERVSPALKNQLLHFDTDTTEIVACEIQRRDFAWNGKWLKNAQISPFYLRLFRYDKMRYERLVNPVSIAEGPVKRLPGYLDHYPFSKGFRAWWSRHLGYADMEATMRIKDHDGKKSFSFQKAFFGKDFTERRYHQKGLFYKLPGRPLVKWFYMVVIRKAFMDGITGITYATLQSIYEYFIVLKTKELLAHNNNNDIEKKRPQRKAGRFVAGGLALLYIIGLVYIFFFARRRLGPFTERNVNLVPFREKIIYMQNTSSSITPYNIEFYKDLVGNILLFIPFPFLLFYTLGIKNIRSLFLLSAITSFSVELTQYILNIGVADIDDLFLNMLGTIIGLFILYFTFIRSSNTLSDRVPA